MQSYKHKATRPLIPSKEEAGMEDGSDVAAAKTTAQIPLNPVVARGQDPELFWMHKYGPDDNQEAKAVDIRSLYRHEHVSPELLIRKLYRQVQDTPKAGDQLGLFAPDVRDLFGNSLDMDEFDKVGEYYRHQGDWSNRLIQGDSLLTMTSLLEREGFAGKVQSIYFDPPYGIKYGSNWQLQLHNRNMPSSDPDEALSFEPEQIKAFRDTWELGIHSYLSYLRERLLIARELLSESGSCFIQISDQNLHLVRCLMDEVFGSNNFISVITVKKSGGMSEDKINNISDFVIWYSKNIELVKCRKLFIEKNLFEGSGARYNQVELTDGTIRPITKEEQLNTRLIPNGAKVFLGGPLTSQTPSVTTTYEFEYNGKTYHPKNRGWSTNRKI